MGSNTSQPESPECPCVDYTAANTADYSLSKELDPKNGMYSCTKLGWSDLSGAQDRSPLYDHFNNFGIIFSPGKGVLIHEDLYNSLPEAARYPRFDCDPRYNSAGALFENSLGQHFFRLPTELGIEHVNVRGETIFRFAILEGQGSGRILTFTVKALVIRYDLPSVKPDCREKTLRSDPLVWIGVGLQGFASGEGSLVQYAYRRDIQLCPNPLYTVRIDGESPETAVV